MLVHKSRVHALRWWGMAILAGIMVLMATGAGRAAGLEEPSRVYGPVTLHYTGKIDGKSPHQMEITIEGDKVTGAYWYDSVGTEISLAGSLRAGKISMTETTADGKVTGRFTGELDPLKSSWQGTWTSGDGKRSLPFELIAVAEIVKSTERRLGHIDVTVARPIFHSSARLGEVDALQSLVDARAWRAARGMVSDDLQEFGLFEPEEDWFFFAADAQMRIWYCSENLISIMQNTFLYTGGAHGMYFTWPLNLAIDADGPREFSLCDMFIAGTGWLEKLSDYVIKSLRSQGASGVLSGEITALDEEMLARFAVGPVGLDFYFAPYDVGAYAEGTYHMRVAWSALKGLVDMGGPAAPVAAGARAN